MKTIGLACLAGAALALLPRVAAADDWSPNTMQTKVVGAFDLWPGREVLGLAWKAEGQIGVTPNVFIDVGLAFGHFSFDAGPFASFNHAVFGNPMIGAHYARFITPDLSFYAGGAAGVPVLADPSQETAITGSFLAGIRAYDEAYYYVPSSLPIRGFGGIEYRIKPVLFLRGEIAPVTYIGISRNQDSEFFMSHSAEIEYRHPSGFGAGGRLQGVFMFTQSDAAQFAMEPFLIYQPGTRGVYLRLGFLIALDEPLGFGFDRNKVATLRFMGGYRF